MKDWSELQLQREHWQLGSRKDQEAFLLHRLKGLLTKAHAEAYLVSVDEAVAYGQLHPGRFHKLWALFLDRRQLHLTALEALSFVIDFIPADRNSIRRTAMAPILGKHLEYAAFLAHPVMRDGWNSKRHIELLRVLGGHNLGFAAMQQRLTAKGFALAKVQARLTDSEQVGLGMLFLQLLLPLGVVEQRSETSWVGGQPRKQLYVTFTEPFWERLALWRNARQIAPRHAPMAVPAVPWAGPGDGGYLGLPGLLSMAFKTDADWSFHCSKIQPAVLGSVNRLQRQPWMLDSKQIDLAREIWQRDIPVGEIPKRDRMMEPREEDFPMGKRTEYWEAQHRYNRDRRRDPNRLRLVASVVLTERLLADGAPLHFVHHMDSRGRIYPRGGGFSYSSGELYRSWFLWPLGAPVRGNEQVLANALASYRGTGSTGQQALAEAIDDRQLLAAIGDDPLSNLALWEGAKSPFRLVQAAREWVAYCRDQSHLTGLVVGIDQASSGFCHVAALCRSTDMARLANVIGEEKSDPYTLIGEVTRQRMREAMDDPDTEPGKANAIEWWLNHWPGRKTWKAIVMPVVYGRTHNSIHRHLVDYLAELIGSFYTPEGFAVVKLAHVLGMKAYWATADTLPEVARWRLWVGEYTKRWLKAGVYARWPTPNGLIVDRVSRESSLVTYTLPIKGRKVSFTGRKQGGLKIPSHYGGFSADIVHSFDAALAQRIVHSWPEDRPIGSLHDCWLTDLSSLNKLHQHALNQFHRLYQVDWLDEIDQYQLEFLPRQEGDRKTSTKPPKGDLDIALIGMNRHMFSQ
jgi:DNA-directed RNA polymerase